MTDTWIPPEPIYRTVGHLRANYIHCPLCDWRLYSAVGTSAAVERVARDHIAQHAPGRAPNIEVDYGLIADCSICPDRGKIATDNTSLWCETCGTTWDMDGTGGQRA